MQFLIPYQFSDLRRLFIPAQTHAVGGTSISHLHATEISENRSKLYCTDLMKLESAILWIRRIFRVQITADTGFRPIGVKDRIKHTCSWLKEARLKRWFVFLSTFRKYVLLVKMLVVYGYWYSTLSVNVDLLKWVYNLMLLEVLTLIILIPGFRTALLLWSTLMTFIATLR